MTSRKVSDQVDKTKICKWKGCRHSGSFSTIEDLLDHVIAKHIPKVIKSKNGEEEKVICQWEDCETSTSRGSLDKKSLWMQNHFKTRHAKSAKTFKCLFEGCDIIKANSRELETHVRLYHPVVPKKEVKKEKTPPASPPVPQNRIWKVVDGVVTWDPPMRVYKKTIIHYDDGPRYVFPTGCTRCNYESDESELGSDEYWSNGEFEEFEKPEEAKRRRRVKRKKEKKIVEIIEEKKPIIKESTPPPPKLFKEPKAKKIKLEEELDEMPILQYYGTEIDDFMYQDEKNNSEFLIEKCQSRQKRNLNLRHSDIDSDSNDSSEFQDLDSPRKKKSPKLKFFKVIKSKRPSRACRVQGSLEEVPFDMEILVEFEKIEPKRSPQKAVKSSSSKRTKSIRL